MPGPTFFVIGAKKSGTTAIWDYLKQHPQVSLCRIKEPRFFVRAAAPPDAVRLPHFFVPVDTLGDYLQLFDGAAVSRAVGEASRDYLFYPGVAEAISRHCRDARFIAVLRDPVERALSEFRFHWSLGAGLRPNPLRRLLREDPGANPYYVNEHCYLARGMYATQLERFRRVLEMRVFSFCGQKI